MHDEVVINRLTPSLHSSRPRPVVLQYESVKELDALGVTLDARVLGFLLLER